ncbi:EthD family reductase [Chitinophaga qingshengii]|uniref:EthD family reductase n=1 Tax=Chitinophaga qingshengii TaxID=1569794 RepID=A0ABR7TU08_9BACT|nr:EthD family reductase [Chitinophaga qingshengii]MBC9933102.1 EthD family reductase [Chitinophaga qingshengii]
MKFKVILSFLLLTTCLVAFSQEKPSGKPKQHDMTVNEKGLIKISVMYPYAEGKTFNMEYYETRHMPMMAGFIGSNLVKYTIEKGLSGRAPEDPLPFMAIGVFYVKSLSEYRAAVAPHINEILADIVKYTNATPTIFVSEVVK